jgi:hypothetical protein
LSHVALKRTAFDVHIALHSPYCATTLERNVALENGLRKNALDGAVQHDGPTLHFSHI